MYKSAALICDGLAKALNTTSYDDISIADVCRPNGIARTTFYRLFDTLDDVLLYQFDTLFKDSIAKYTEDEDPGKSFARTILEIATHNKALVSAIVASGRSDLFSASTISNEDSILKNVNLQITKKDSLYCTAMLTQLAYAVISIWVNTGCHESTAQLYQIMKREIKLIYTNL
jgi:AcrR family transcriptional regulator